MRKILCVLFIFLLEIQLFAQVEPVQNNNGVLADFNVKTISSFYYPTVDTSNIKGQLLLKKEFDKDGKITNKYLLSLWEAVSYSYLTTYIYNDTDQLVEELQIQTILNLEERDDVFIQSFGSLPLNKKITYGYTDDGLPAQKEIFTFNSEHLSDTTQPSQKIVYAYESGLLRSEKSSSANTVMFNYNYTIDYEYDQQENLIKETKTYGSKMNLKRTTDFVYDSAGQVSEEVIIDKGVPRNNAHFKYEYDKEGLVKTKLVFDPEVNEFTLLESYQHDAHGNQILGEKSIEFTYYENGLIYSEQWKDEISDKVFYFVTNYSFY